MESRSNDVGTELRMHSLIVKCDTYLDEEKFAIFVPVAMLMLR